MKSVLLLVYIFISPNLFASNGIVGKSIDPNDKSAASLFVDELKPFTSDGCSRYPNGTEEKPDLWLDCCIEHDSKYWLGGPEAEKNKADLALRDCVAKKDTPWRANKMYWAVQHFGGPENNTDYRWGYGWTRLRYFKPVSQSELKIAQNMYGENLEGLEELVTSQKALVPQPTDHTYNIPIDYNFCEEQALLYLRDHLTAAATILSSRLWTPTTDDHKLIVGLDICGSDTLEITFNSATTVRTCQHDYYYADTANKILRVKTPAACKGNFK